MTSHAPAFALIGAIALAAAPSAQAQVVVATTETSGCASQCWDDTLRVQDPSLPLVTSSLTGGTPPDASASCTTSVAVGRVRAARSTASYGALIGGSARCASSALSDDTVVAGAPGVAPGTPMSYTATLRLATGVAGVDPTGKVSIGLCVFLGQGTQCIYGAGTLRLRVNTTAGQVLRVGLQLDTGVRADNDTPTATAAIDQPVRLSLRSSTAGANITGASGYTYR